MNTLRFVDEISGKILEHMEQSCKLNTLHYFTVKQLLTTGKDDNYLGLLLHISFFIDELKYMTFYIKYQQLVKSGLNIQTINPTPTFRLSLHNICSH